METQTLEEAPMSDLTEWAWWETASLLPVEPNKLHAAAQVTILRVYKHEGQTWVRYMYCDHTFYGLFCGRDNDTEEDFRRMFPVKRVEYGPCAARPL